MPDNINVEITETPQNVNVNITDAPQSVSVGINTTQTIWGAIIGTLSNQTDLWSELSAKALNVDLQLLKTFVETNSAQWDETADIIPTVVNFLSSTSVAFNTINVTGQALSAGVPLHNIFLTAESDSQTLSYSPSSYLLTISNGNTVNLSSINSLFEAVSGKYEEVYSNVVSNSGNWNTAYDVGTNYQATSSSFATNTSLNSASSLLTPLTLTNTLTGLLVTDTAFLNYQTSVGSSTATLLPTSIYQNASSNWQSTYTIVQNNSASWEESADITAITTTVASNSANWDTAYNIGTAFQNISGSLAGNNIYQDLTGNWQNAYTNVVTNSAAYLTGVNLTFLQEPSANWNSTYTTVQSNSSNWQNAYNTTTVFQTISSSYATNTALNAASSVLLPTSLYQNTSGQFALSAHTHLPNAIIGSVNSAISLVDGNDTNTAALFYDSSSDGWTIFDSNGFNSKLGLDTASQMPSSIFATNVYVDTNFFPLSGGVISGPTRINNNLTVFGNLTATGTTTFANTIFSVTSSLSVVHIGSGPALYVGNNGDGDIASFYDIDQGIEILHVGGNNGTFPNVGVKTSVPNKALTVAGEISATQDITTSGKFFIQGDGNSDQWNQAYNVATAYQSVSSSFATNTIVNNVSSLLTPLTLTNTLTSQLLPTSVYQNVSGSYATIAFTDSKFLPLSGGTITGDLNVTGQILSGGINISQVLSSVGGGGGGVTPIRRFDYTTVASVDISYSGTAPFGTLETNPIWKLTRLTYANNGTISNQASSTNSWTGRLTASYITI